MTATTLAEILQTNIRSVELVKEIQKTREELKALQTKLETKIKELNDTLTPIGEAFEGRLNEVAKTINEKGREIEQNISENSKTMTTGEISSKKWEIVPCYISAALEMTKASGQVVWDFAKEGGIVKSLKIAKDIAEIALKAGWMEVQQNKVNYMNVVDALCRQIKLENGQVVFTEFKEKGLNELNAIGAAMASEMNAKSYDKTKNLNTPVRQCIEDNHDWQKAIVGWIVCIAQPFINLFNAIKNSEITLEDIKKFDFSKITASKEFDEKPKYGEKSSFQDRIGGQIVNKENGGKIIS